MASATKENSILLVDDDVTGRTVRKLVLELRDHQVVAVGEAEAALHALQTQPIELVIVDYFLDGVKGTELARQIRELKPDVPILLLSGSGEVPEGIEHVDKYLCKLDSVDMIEQAIADLLHKDATIVRHAFPSSSPCRTQHKHTILPPNETDLGNS